MTDASSLMGPLLLMGWGMMSDACEKDQLPRMENKKLKASVCCGCEPRLAKLIADGCKIVADGPLFLIQNDSKSIQFRVRKEDGWLKFAGDNVSTYEPVPEAAQAIEEEKSSAPVA